MRLCQKKDQLTGPQDHKLVEGCHCGCGNMNENHAIQVWKLVSGPQSYSWSCGGFIEWRFELMYKCIFENILPFFFFFFYKFVLSYLMHPVYYHYCLSGFKNYNFFLSLSIYSTQAKKKQFKTRGDGGKRKRVGRKRKGLWFGNLASHPHSQKSETKPAKYLLCKQ